MLGDALELSFTLSLTAFSLGFFVRLGWLAAGRLWLLIHEFLSAVKHGA